MSFESFRYIWDDVQSGLKRNKGASLASIILIFVAVTLIGGLLLMRLALEDTITYVESQISMKVYVEKGYDTEQLSSVLVENDFIQSVEVETGDEVLAGLSHFFMNREHLLDSFTNGAMNDAIKVHVTDASLIEEVARSLDGMQGIAEVIYPQEMAQTLYEWIKKVETYVSIIAIILLIIACMVAYIAFHLALYQREKEIRVKLLVGANPAHVRLQFLIEGFLLGLVGGILSLFSTFALFKLVLHPIEQAVPFLIQLDSSNRIIVFSLQCIVSIVIGIGASFLATRKLIRDV
ncbi:permease-like cell division protein FtsX [Cytobacillus sp. FSL M8-0252]|uniref:cell division protein FtsX n=1 Tax=Cytobacillus sp. FSL M8-0252 TaxID=2921621 RepID=UPI0030F6E112